MKAKKLGAGIILRPFKSDDIVALAALHVAARASMPLVDEPHGLSEHASYIAGLSVGCTITVADLGGALAGFLSHARKQGENTGLISHLYIHPDHHRQGVGAQLLDDALDRFPAPLHLWCFEANSPARALYESRGFTAIERTDGAGNDENLPDVHYLWRS